MWTQKSNKGNSEDDAYDKMRQQVIENKRRENTLKKVRLNRELDDARRRGDQKEISRISRELKNLQFNK